MIECNGTHVITHKHKHGNSVYRCTLANLNGLLANVLQYEAQYLADLAKQLTAEPKTVRAYSWLTQALKEVRERHQNPRALRNLLYGSRSAKSKTDTRPEVTVTAAMQEELVLFSFHNRLDLQQLSGDREPTPEMLTTCWTKLPLLEPARKLREAGGITEIMFLSDVAVDGLSQLKTLQQGQWKETAKEESVARSYTQFFNEWGSGFWDVEEVQDYA